MRGFVVGLLLLVACSGPTPPRPEQPAAVDVGWKDRTEAAGLSGVTSPCASASLADLDGDGAPDLVLADGGLVVLHNDGAGHFAPWAAVQLEQADAAAMVRICPQMIADLDGDGRLDVVIGLNGGDRLAVFFNDGGGAFTAKLFGTFDGTDSNPYAMGVVGALGNAQVLLVGRVVESAEKGLTASQCGYDVRGINIECRVSSADVPGVAWKIDGPHRELLPMVAPLLTEAGNSYAYGIFGGGQDIVAAIDFQPQRHARGATEDGFKAANDLDVFGHGMGVALGDWDGDGIDDVVISTLGGVLDFAGLAGGGYLFRADASQIMTRRRAIWPWAALLADFDNDGREDLFLANKYASDGAGPNEDPVPWMDTLGGVLDFNGFDSVFFQRGAGLVTEGRVRFSSMLPASPVMHGHGRSVAVADVDGDGSVELAMLLGSADSGPNALALGSLDVSHGHGLTLRFVGRPAPPGTSAEIVCGGRSVTRTLYGSEGHVSAARGELHIGCGEAVSYTGLVLHVPGAPPIVLAGGALDRAVAVRLP